MPTTAFRLQVTLHGEKGCATWRVGYVIFKNKKGKSVNPIEVGSRRFLYAITHKMKTMYSFMLTIYLAFSVF